MKYYKKDGMIFLNFWYEPNRITKNNLKIELDLSNSKSNVENVYTLEWLIERWYILENKEKCSSLNFLSRFE